MRHPKSTPKKGLLRLGNWRETTHEDWLAFKAGRGVRQDGTPWERPDFKHRFYFIVTRGLESMDFMRAVGEDPKALNIQISVDIIVQNGRVRQIPHDARLRELASIPKVMFRFKTLHESRRHGGQDYEANASLFLALRERLGIAPVRVLETPLRLGTHSYGDTTPLERAGLPASSFLRCNTPCNSCKGENGFLACAATERILQRLAVKGTATPARLPKAPDVHVDWKLLVHRALEDLGGTASLQALYARVNELEPAAQRNPIWDVKVRQAVRRVATRVGPATWSLKTALPPAGVPVGAGVAPEGTA
jgi:hypothetical protein